MKSLRKYQQACVRLSGKIIHQTAMITPHDRVAVAVSGGVDSFTLLQCLLIRQKMLPFPFELIVIHINPGFDLASHGPLLPWLTEHGLASHIEISDVGPYAHSKDNSSNSPCYLCSQLRRNRLFDLCRIYQCNRLAFGHTGDDLLATMFMGGMQAGRFDGMLLKQELFQGNLTIIRPLALLEKTTIIHAAKAWDLPVWKNSCPSAANTLRTEMDAWIQNITRHDSRKKRNLLHALIRYQLDLVARIH